MTVARRRARGEESRSAVSTVSDCGAAVDGRITTDYRVDLAATTAVWSSAYPNPPPLCPRRVSGAAREAAAPEQTVKAGAQWLFLKRLAGEDGGPTSPPSIPPIPSAQTAVAHAIVCGFRYIPRLIT